MTETDKVKAFTAHILEECEREAFTVAELRRLPQELRFAVNTKIEDVLCRVKIVPQ